MKVKILHLEDNAQDAELVATCLNAEGEGINCDIWLIDSRERYLAALDGGGFDLILADYSLASLDGLSALRIAKEKWPETPFILVTGALGDEAAVECLKLGATDYVLKHHLFRLVPCIKRALRESEALEARKMADVQLRVQSSALNAAANAIVITDRPGRIIWVNPAFSKLTGYSSQEALGRSPRLLKSGMHDQRFYEVLWKTISSGAVWSGETINRRKDGTLYVEEQCITPVRDDDGKISHFIAIKQDISERKQMEQARRDRNLAEAANRIKSEFLANMSHELRTPLNGIIGFSQLMHDGKVGPVSVPHKEYLGDILTSGRHLLQLINEILDLAKVESGKMEFRPESLDFAQIVSEVRGTLLGLAAQKNIQLETHFDPSLVGIFTDVKSFKQVLYNYLSNAIKFTDEDGCVRLRLRAEPPDHFRIEVEDSGRGISPDDIGKLFVEFQQLDNSREKRHAGTGLGLALTKRLVEAQGGHVGVSSVVGQGSTFFAVLPRIAETAGFINQRRRQSDRIL